MGSARFLCFHHLLLLILLHDPVNGVCKDGPLTELEQLIVNWHNIFRSRHLDLDPICYGVPGDDIDFKSDFWAQHLTEDGVQFHHFPDPKPFGENMMWTNFYDDEPDPEFLFLKAMHKWYKEIENWDFEEGDKHRDRQNATTTHFTQVVWKSTVQVNCAYSWVTVPKKIAYVVCQYWPPGNLVHEYKTHVPRADPNYVPDPSKELLVIPKHI